jgi:hypothetical protein
MAATEVIRFPLWAQLGLRLLIQDQILFQPVSLFPPNLPPKCGCPLTGAECPWGLSVRRRGGQ